ncbi:MAG: hypothetical protein K0V04_06065 [Deltaproteobacteria bacterium]|nr:hypothetical protein [Deltaproteobacteria bacterium]
MRLGLQVAVVLVTAATVPTGCGPRIVDTPEPQQWMLGTFSTLSPEGGDFLDSTLHYHFEDDGTVVVEQLDGCGTEPTMSWPLSWETVDADTLRLSAPPDAEPFPLAHFDGWLLERTADCGGFELVGVLEGEPYEVVVLHRGMLCMSPGQEMPDCVGTDCRVCHKQWCEPPPAC